MRNPSPSAPAGWNTSRHIQSSSHRKTARYEASGRAETLDRTDFSRSVPPPPVFLARRRAARRKKIGRPTRRVHVWNVRALPRRNRCSTAGARAGHRRFPAAETSAVGPNSSGAAGTPACAAGWSIKLQGNGVPQPSHPRRAQNQGAYPTPSMVARTAATDLYAAAAPRRRGPRGGIWSTPEPPPMGAPTVRLTPRGHGRPLRPPERAAVRRKLGLRGLRSRPARTCLVLKPAKRLAIRPKASACFWHV